MNQYIPQQRNKFAILYREKRLLESHFEFVNCTINNGFLYCYGFYQPTSTVYKYRVRYDGFNNPNVTITSPIVEYSDDIHMYPSGNCLCLHYPADKDWTSRLCIYATIIPWTHEWFVFYELYLITGIWKHPFVPHRRITSDLSISTNRER
jgi:hypothetical protein